MTKTRIGAVLLLVAATAWTTTAAQAADQHMAKKQTAASAFIAVAQVPHSKQAWALGDSYPKGAEHLVLAHGSPSHWSQTTSTIPNAENLGLLAAGSTTRVWVAGLKAKPDLTSTPVIRMLSHHKLVLQKLPALGAPSGRITAIDASSAKDAWAVGFTQDANTNVTHSLALHWNGHKWSRVHVLGDTDNTGLTSVDSSSPTSAWVLGTGSDGGPLVAHWDGKTWTKSPYSRPDSDTHPVAIAGTTADNAFVIGTQDRASGISLITYFYASHWNGHSWVDATNNTQHASVVAGAAAGSTAFAVGSVSGSSGNSPLILHFTGGAWHAQSSPHHGSSTMLSAVSANSPTHATAVGFSGTSNSVGIVESYVGGKWKQQSIAR